MGPITRFQFLRATTAQRLAIVPLKAELIYDTDTDEVWMGDGVTAGGIPLSNLSNEQIQDIAASLFGSSSTIDVNYNDLLNQITLTVIQTAIDHTQLLNRGANTHAQIDIHIASTANPHNTTAAQVGADPVGSAAAAQAFAIQRANHTGTQLASTISDFATTVLGTILAGLSLLTNSAITAADSILVAFGKLQAQINAHFGVGGSTHPDATTSVSGFMSAADKTKLNGIGGARVIKSGTIAAGSFVGTPRVSAVTFSTPFANTNYSIAISGANSRSWSFQAKATTGFTINSNANGALSGEVTWTAIDYGETVE